MNSNNMVQVFTSLPPCIKKVDPFFYLHFQINHIKFITKNNINYDNIDARVVWWGEEGNGTIFTPRCVNLAGYKQNVKTYAIYSVCVPINHFTTYLCDMDKLYIDIIDKTKHSVIGKAIVDDIKQLGYNKSFQSVCNIINEGRNKIGELMVVMTLEPGKTNNVTTINKPANNLIETKCEILSNGRENSNNENQHSPRIVAKLTDSIERMEQSQNLIDDLIEKGKRLRETIAINVKDDEINEDIARRTIPQLDYETSHLKPSDDEWLKRVLAEESSHNFSLNDISKINTESILESSPIFARKHRQLADNCNLNNDTEALKLLTVSDSYCSEFDTDIGRYKHLTRSVEDIIGIEKQLSSDDDPGKHESIIEELFYKQQTSENEAEFGDTSKTIQRQKKAVINTDNNRYNSVKSDFEIYKSISQDQKEAAGIARNYADDALDANVSDDMCADGDAKKWYRHISAIKVSIDMLWLNPCNQSPTKMNRSRSQSPNCSSDRERCRRSHDSASSFNNSSVSTTASKPPVSRSLQWNPACKYFIEYKFPVCVVDDVDREKENYSNERCPVRVTVKSMTGSSHSGQGVRAFELNHTSEFPVSFNNATIEQWWKGVVRFRLICQDNGNKETVVGVSVLPLRNVISTNNFYRLVPMRLPRNRLNKSRVVVGSLAIRTTMAMSAPDTQYDGMDYSSFKADRLRSNTVQSDRYRAQSHAPRTMSFVHRNNNNNNLRPVQYRAQKGAPLRHTVASSSPSVRMHPISLMSLLSVSSVRYINTKMTSGDYRSGIRSCNLYLIGRLLWGQDHKIKSRILWGSSKISDSESSIDLENFKLSEKVALILTVDLMDKLRNNYAILEVWDKSTDNTKDILYGLVKIPMNILCMSFANDHIRRTVLNNVYPVMCCDDWVNVEDALTGKSKGQIHVMLALGSQQQIDNLELSKENTVDGHWNRNYMAATVSHGDLVEHSIEIDVESLRNVDLSFLPDSATKECFCYVQYYFPQQQTISDCNARNWNSAIFRAVSHPVQANIDISDTNRHRFRLPIDCSLKSALNSNFEVMGKKHVLFELYTKVYNPFPSTRPIAKGRLQLASLFQLINQHSVSVDSMADTLTRQQIPVRLICGDESDSVNSIGTLNIGVCYRTKLIENSSRTVTSSNVASPLDQPIVKIELLSATGLQKASESLVRVHPELEYASVTGVNSHAKYWLTDESNKQSRINVNSKGIQKFKVHRTKTVPHSFTPKYDSINEVLLGPIVDNSDCHTLYRTLAEKILMGVYQFNVELYHDVPKSIYCDFEEESAMSTILIGKGRISLSDLLLRSSGIMGPMWLTVFSPMNLDSGFGGCKLNITGKRKFDSLYSIEKREAVGAVEIKLSFNDKVDRKNILQLAMDIGYAVPWTTRLETEDLIWQSMDVHGCTFKNITVTIEEVELSSKLINCVFTAEAGFKRSSMKIITRYRIYKQAISSSPYFMLNEEELRERIFIPVNHQQQYCYRVSSDLFRYLRESKLEIQVWSIYGATCTIPFDSDYQQSDNPNDVRLLGSAFFDLSSLILPSDGNHKTVSHILPLWKRGVQNCDNANVTVTVDICGATSPLPDYLSDSDDNAYGSKNNNCFPGNTNSRTVDKSRINHQQSFPAHIIIEKAVNLNRIVARTEVKCCENNSEKPLNYFVCFPCQEETKTIQSTVVKGYKEVSWNFECDSRLSYSLLTANESSLEFKLYHSATESEVLEEIMDQRTLIGIAKIDLSLLLKGFERVIGWYNIVDMQGDCQGQVKIGVTPLVPLVAKSASVTAFKQSIPTTTDKPISLEDHQNYLSSVKMRLRGEVNTAPIVSFSTPQRYNYGESSHEPDYQESLSKSILYSTLKEKLKELDGFNERFKRKMFSDDLSPSNGNDYNNFVPSNENADNNFVPSNENKYNFGSTNENEDNNFVLTNGNDNNNAITDNIQKQTDHLDEDRQTMNIRNPNNKKQLSDQETKIEDRSLLDKGYEHDFNDYYNEPISDSDDDYQWKDGEEDGEENLSNIVCINDTDNTKHVNNEASDPEDGLERDSMSIPDNAGEDKRPLYDSDSDCSILLSDDMYASKQPVSDGRCHNGKYDEVEIDEILEAGNNNRREFVSSSKDLNDSWESTNFSPARYVAQDTNEVPTSTNTMKANSKIQTKTLIPRFFPPSVDFQEKMKALKRTIEVDRTSTQVNDYKNKPSAVDKRPQMTEMSDSETKRLSKIFGIK